MTDDLRRERNRNVLSSVVGRLSFSVIGCLSLVSSSLVSSSSVIRYLRMSALGNSSIAINLSACSFISVFAVRLKAATSTTLPWPHFR